MTCRYSIRFAAFILAPLLAACAAQLPPVPPSGRSQPIITTTFTPAATAGPAAMAAQRIVAGQGWQDTYLFIHAGDKLELTASGAWSHAPSDPRYSTLYGPGGVNVFDPEAVLASAPLGSLVGRIGAGSPFLVGEHLGLASEERGELWLSINEHADQLADNTGSVDVTIRFSARPEAQGEHLLNELDRYRLLYPAQYSVVLREGGVCFTLSGATTGACDRTGSASLQVSDAQGQSIEQIADVLAPPNDLNIQMDRFPIAVDGEAALRLDGRMASGSWRIVIILHGGRSYLWKFGPWTDTPGLINEYEELERLYETLMSSFQFLD